MMEPLRPGDILQERYTIECIIGRGGMGHVYKAHDGKENCLIALKEMVPPDDSPSSSTFHVYLQLFEQEGQLLKSLRHPYLPTFYNTFSENQRFYIAMEYIDGDSLKTLIEKSPDGKLSVDAVITYAEQICEVLSYLHGQFRPVIYRDLKPNNVMVRNGHRSIVLIDFGIARYFTPGKSEDTHKFGSYGYAPLEQLQGGPTNPASDLYALGATIYHCVTGIHPNKYLDMQLPPASSANPAVPPQLDQLIARLLEKESEKRPLNALVVLQMLKAVRSRHEDIEETIRLRDPRFAQAASALQQMADILSRAPIWIARTIKPLLPLLAWIWASMRYAFQQFLPVCTRLGRWILSIHHRLPVGLRRVRGEITDAYHRWQQIVADWQSEWQRRRQARSQSRVSRQPTQSLSYDVSVPAPAHPATPVRVLAEPATILRPTGRLVITLIGSMALLFFLPTLQFLVLWLVVLWVLLVQIRGYVRRGITSHVRDILALEIVCVLFACCALTSLSAVQEPLVYATVNDFASLLLLGLCGASLVRPVGRFFWLDHLALIAIALLDIALLIGPEQRMLAALFSSSAAQIIVVVALVICLCAVLALMWVKRSLKPFQRFIVVSYTFPVLFGAVDTVVQETPSFSQLPAHIVPLISLILAVIGFFLAGLSVNVQDEGKNTALDILARIARFPLLLLAVVGLLLFRSPGSEAALISHAPFLAMQPIVLAGGRTIIPVALVAMMLLLFFLIWRRQILPLFDHAIVVGIGLICFFLASSRWGNDPEPTVQALSFVALAWGRWLIIAVLSFATLAIVLHSTRRSFWNGVFFTLVDYLSGVAERLLVACCAVLVVLLLHWYEPPLVQALDHGIDTESFPLVPTFVFFLAIILAVGAWVRCLAFMFDWLKVRTQVIGRLRRLGNILLFLIAIFCLLLWVDPGRQDRWDLLPSLCPLIVTTSIPLMWSIGALLLAGLIMLGLARQSHTPGRSSLALALVLTATICFLIALVGEWFLPLKSPVIALLLAGVLLLAQAIVAVVRSPTPSNKRA